MSEQKYKTLETYANILNKILSVDKGFSVGKIRYLEYEEINPKDLLRSRSDLERLLVEKKVSLKEEGESFLVQSIDEEHIAYIDTTSNPPNPQKKQITEDLRVSLSKVCEAKGLDITKLKDSDISIFGLEMSDFIVLQDQLLEDLPSGTHNFGKEEMENAISKSLISFRNFLRDKLGQENSDLYKIIEEDYSNDLQGFCRFIDKVQNSQLELSHNCKGKMDTFLRENNFTRDVNSIMESISTKLGFNIRSIVKFTPERGFVLSEELHSESNLPSSSASNASLDSLGSLRTNDSYR
jgi:hypothetical protein